jgi:hypothetical protein
VRTVRDVLKRHSVNLALTASVSRRIETAVEEQAGAGQAITREFKLEVAKSEVEFYWAVAATKMLLMPAQDLPQDERLQRLQKLLSQGEKEIRSAPGAGRGEIKGSVVIDGRNMITELRDVAAFVMRMILAAPPAEFSKRYKRGGPEAMLKYGEKVAATQPPIEAQAVSDFIALATIHAESPGASRKGLQKLSEEYADYMERGMHPEAAGRAEFRKELAAIARLKRLRRDPAKFMAALEEEREKVAHMTGPMRDLAKVELRKLAREIVPPSIWEDEWKVRAYAMTQTLRDQARGLYAAQGVPATEKMIDQVLMAGKWDWDDWPGRKKPLGWPRPPKPLAPRGRGLPAKWVDWMVSLRDSPPGTVLPPEPQRAPVHPVMGLAVAPKVEAAALREPIVPLPKKRRRPKKMTEKKRKEWDAREREERKEWEKQVQRAIALRTMERERPDRESEKRRREAERAAMAEQQERRERLAYDLLEQGTPHPLIAARTGIHLTERGAIKILNKWRKRLKVKKRKIAEPKASGGLWATVYSLLLAKATPQEIEEMTGSFFPEESGVYGVRDPMSGRMNQVEMTGLAEIRVRMKTRGVTKDFQEKVKKDLKLHREIKKERERRALAKAAELAAMEAAKAESNPPWSWGDRLMVRVNAALVTGAPMKRLKREQKPRRATRHNPDRSSALRRMMRL